MQNKKAPSVEIDVTIPAERKLAGAKFAATADYCVRQYHTSLISVNGGAPFAQRTYKFIPGELPSGTEIKLMDNGKQIGSVMSQDLVKAVRDGNGTALMGYINAVIYKNGTARGAYNGTESFNEFVAHERLLKSNGLNEVKPKQQEKTQEPQVGPPLPTPKAPHPRRGGIE